MADVVSFSPDDAIQNPVDFLLLRDGGVALVLGDDVLEQLQADLSSLGYSLVSVDLRDGDVVHLHDGFSAALDFPSYYGRNLNALDDCLSDVAYGDYGWDATSTGLAITVRRFGALNGQDPQTARIVAEILCGTSSYGLLFGHRVISLLQVDDPHVHIGPVGGRRVSWTHRQWRTSLRVPDR